MVLQTRKTLNLTKKEKSTIKQLYDILDNDNQLSLNDVWDLLTDIACMSENEEYLSTNYGYDIKVF